MSYNYLLNTFDGSIGCEINNLELTNSTSVYNGSLKNEVNRSSGFKDLNNIRNQIKFNDLGNLNVNISPEANLTDNKLRFSEKLKVLLKNGRSKSDKIDLPEAYAFSEVEAQHAGTLNKALNSVELCMGKTTPTQIKASNGTTQKSIMFPKFVPPQTTSNDIVENADCNGETTSNVKKNLKIAKFAVPVIATNHFVDLNQAIYKLQPNNYSDNSKMSGLKNGKTVHAPLSSNNKYFGKTKLQSTKPASVINTIKANRNASGKSGAGQSQVHKQGCLKTEKKLDSKNRSFHKGKSLLNQLQKTALLNRPTSQQVKKNFSKNSFSGTNRCIQRQTEGLPMLNATTKSMSKKSLLEESLLGLKTPNRNLSNGTISKTNSSDCNYSKSDSKSILETGKTAALSPARLRTDSLDQGKHESLERIWNIRNKLKGLKRDHHHFGLTINDCEYDDNSSSECLLFQNYWFSMCGDYDSASSNNGRRDTKLSQLKVELRHKIKQLQWRYKDEYRDKVVELLVESARKQPNLTAFLIRLENSKFNDRKKISRVKPFNLMRPPLCTFANPETGQICQERAMPCVKFCQQHITYSNDQLLFTSCSALRSDNKTCRAAVLNQSVENPLCLKHKRLLNKSEMPKKLLNSKSVSRASQQRKRSRSCTGGSSRSGRSKKRRRSGQKEKNEILNGNVGSSTFVNNSQPNFKIGKDLDNNSSYKQHIILEKSNPQIISKCDMDESQEVEVGEEVLAIAEDLPLELATQATKLLEEHDFTNVLNHIPADAFNDLFTEDKEEYQPTPQETEELERALEAVDNDVKSLEKLSQTQGILDSLLDEQTIAQTLAQLPEVTANIEVPQTLVPVFYQNGFSNINQLEQTLNDVNKSLNQTVILNQGSEAVANHHFSNLNIPNHADVLQS